MANNYFVSLAKLSGAGKLLVAARHNRRTLPNERGSIDSTCSNKNYSLAGAATPNAINEEAESLMKAAGINTLRSNCVRAVEVLYSLPASHRVNLEEYFLDCLAWTRSYFPGVVLSFDVHLDESTPHAHALILPLIDGRMKGSDMVGNKYDLQAMHIRFYEVVGIKYRLHKPTARLSGQAKLETCRDVLDRLQDDPVMKSQIWQQIHDSIFIDPVPYAHSLGVQIANPKPSAHKPFVGIMTS